MNRNLTVCFNDLVDILMNYTNEKYQDKYLWEMKCEEIQLLFINMSYILNSYRPHQARQQVITILQNQIQKKEQAIKEIQGLLKEISIEKSNLKRKQEETQEEPEKKEIKQQTKIDLSQFYKIYQEIPF